MVYHDQSFFNQIWILRCLGTIEFTPLLLPQTVLLQNRVFRVFYQESGKTLKSIITSDPAEIENYG